MTSRFHGIFANKLSDGTITSVQCKDTTGLGNDMLIDTYRQRGIQPPAESLPDQHQYQEKTQNQATESLPPADVRPTNKATSMKRTPAKTRGQMATTFGAHPERGADDNLRLRDALRKAGETCEAARKIADEALAIWPETDSF